MALPNPPIDIAGSCTAVFNNTLFIYSSAGFQSISLSKGATWQVLSPGIAVTGATCVNSNATGNANPAFWVVGGTANSTQSSYPGLQRYLYSIGKWEDISPEVLVTQNRRNHGAAYLAASSSIVVYAGSQDPDNTLPSSQTFLISTVAPYQVLSFISPAPPLTMPMMMAWDDSSALMVGGASDNTQLYIFSPTGWSELGTALSFPITDEMTVQCDIVTGDDGSKVLQRYDMSVSPNTVTRYLLWQNNAPVAPGTTIGTGKNKARLRRDGTHLRQRDLTAQNWPAYNATGAPNTIREGFSIAQAPNGYAVISGGSTSNPVVIFSERQNAWVDTSAVFGTQLATPSTTRSSSQPSGTGGSIPPSSTSTAVNPPANHAFILLGATLGAVLGFAAIIIILIILLKWRKDKKEKRAQETKAAAEKNNRLSFADQGAVFMHEAGTGKESRPYTEQGEQRNDSVTSLQMMGGRFPPSTNHSRTGHRRGPSDGSTLGLMDHKGPAGGVPADDGGHHRFGAGAVAGGLVGAAAGAGAAMEMNHLHHRREDMTKSPSSGTRVNSPYSPPLPPVHGQETDDMHEPLGRSAGGWSTYFANDNAPVTDLSTSPTGQQSQYLDRQQHGSGDKPGVPNSFLHAPSTRTSDISASEYDTMPSRGNSHLRPLDLNLGPRFDPTSAVAAPGGGYGAYGTSPPRDGYGRAISTSTYDPSHWSILSDDRISPRSSVQTNYPPGGMIGNAFSVPGNPLTNPLPPIPSAQPYSQSQDQHLRNRLGIGGGGFSPTNRGGGAGPSPPPTSPLPPAPLFAGSGLQNLRGGGGRDGSPSPSDLQRQAVADAARGPRIRKMTGSEDMSWLNINAPPNASRP